MTLQKARANRPEEPATAVALVPSAEARIWRKKEEEEEAE